ncbi:hypothetical protein OSB04_015609 [Centaurea solstitialis]|uniref:Uncharacterized protein n=1 Tax=Centaurea solstitialis TaxID=347529 RepID=A0AA38SZD0_9ASTR|nr:hypothetical protein OSB04_015609 [Centaurea solstitialis]
MAYAGFQMFMEDLKMLINGNHHPLINKNPLTLSKRPQFQLLYQELDSIIQTLFSIHEDHHHHPDEFEKVRNLKRRFKDAVQEAQDTIDIFLSALHFTHRGVSHRSDIFRTNLDLEKVMRSIESIKVDLMTINIDNMKMESSPRIDRLKTQSAAARTSSPRHPLGNMKSSMEEMVVGLELDAEIIRDKLAEDRKQLSVVSIVGMGGLGKTTLAIKVFNDRFVVYHFHVRAWVTVSQSYKRRDLLIQILTSIGVQQDLEKDSDCKLREKLHKNLMGRRYLIVMDDIWSIEAWGELKLFFPHENTGSRILLTTRLNEVALHVKPHGFVHSLPCLTEKQSWELLKLKVFHGDQCPEWLIEPGRQIAEKCQGLPLSLVVIAGVLAEEPMNKDLWEIIARRVGSFIVNDKKGCLETLALSYHHLPDHLRECFLYLGGFPEDFRFTVKRLIWLWVAEGFIEEAGNRSLEDTAKDYLEDLINRNLVIVAKRNVNGDVKACKLHDLVRELCMQKAKEERFFFKIDSLPLPAQLLEVTTYKQLRLFTNQDVNILNIAHSPTQISRSLFCFRKDICSVEVIAQSFVLLRMLDLQECRSHDFPYGLELLIHLRYLAICGSDKFPNSICKLWNLQTLILRSNSFRSMHLPRNIQDLVNLRYLWSTGEFVLPYIAKPMKLQSISTVVLNAGIDNLQVCFPNIKKLAIYCESYDECNFDLLPNLETLKLMWPRRRPCHRPNHISLPTTLKKLALFCSFLPWSVMSLIQLLPNLEVLKLKTMAFKGTKWDACEQQFPQLKLLILQSLNIKHWEASSTSFPCLKQLSLSGCYNLEEIPLEIGEIATLELIEIDSSNNSVVESVKRIQQEQHHVGNYEQKITVDGMELSFYLSQREDSESE